MAERSIRISLGRQRLDLLDGDEPIRSYPVSTAKNGPGERDRSECTPRGAHEVSEKIGEACEEGTVFEGRVPTGERCTEELYHADPGRDWILTRILWLGGLEEGRNRGGEVDTHDRTIYIHGTPDLTPLDAPLSHGCIRMRNRDVIALFDLVDTGTRVQIEEDPG